MVVATKGGYAAGEGRPDVLKAQIDESLQRLRTDAIALYYLHRVDPETPLEDSLGAIKEAVDAGKVRHVGISDVSVDQIERARAVLPITAVQNHYSLTERKYEDEVDHCEREGIVFVPYFPLRHGGPPTLESIAERRDATPAQIALGVAPATAVSPTMLPIPGTLSIDHAARGPGGPRDRPHRRGVRGASLKLRRRPEAPVRTRPDRAPTPRYDSITSGSSRIWAGVPSLMI